MDAHKTVKTRRQWARREGPYGKPVQPATKTRAYKFTNNAVKELKEHKGQIPELHLSPSPGVVEGQPQTTMQEELMDPH